MTLKKCQENTKVSKIKVEEKGRKAVFVNLNKATYQKTKVDGCLLKNTLASDWILSKSKCGDVIIELKGVDVDHAVSQVCATATYWRANGHGIGALAALVICRQYPRIDTKIQRAQQMLAKSFGAPLHVVSGNSEFVFEHVLSFRGPFAA